MPPFRRHFEPAGPDPPLSATGLAPISPAASSPDNVRRCIGLQRWQRLADWRRLDLVEDTLQRADPRRERVAVFVDRLAEQPDEGDGFVIG
jgi:hypothetical protein